MGMAVPFTAVAVAVSMVVVIMVVLVVVVRIIVHSGGGENLDGERGALRRYSVTQAACRDAGCLGFVSDEFVPGRPKGLALAFPRELSGCLDGKTARTSVCGAKG
jgi:hypothetical protein